MQTHARVVVIGGGVGCSVLYRLAKFGCRDAVLPDRDELTSGGYAHGSGLSVALGYVDKDIAESDGPWSIEIRGERFPARMQRVPLFDADGRRQRG